MNIGKPLTCSKFPKKESITWTMGRILARGDILWSSTVVVATKLNPLKSWWAFALGGTPGESRGTQTHRISVATSQQDHFMTFRRGML